MGHAALQPCFSQSMRAHRCLTISCPRFSREPASHAGVAARAAAAKFTGSGGAVVVLCRSADQEAALRRLCHEEAWSLHPVRVAPPNFASVP